MLTENPPIWAVFCLLQLTALLAMIVGAIIVSNAYKRNPSEDSRFIYIGEFIFKLVPTTVAVIVVSCFLVLLMGFALAAFRSGL